MRRTLLYSVAMITGSLFAQTPEQAVALAAIKDYALNYTQKMPNYTAIQSVKRQVRPTTQGRLVVGSRSRTDVVEEQLGYVDHRELHKVLTVNGQAVKEGDNDQSGMYSRGEFVLLLDTIFRPETKTVFQFERMAAIDGRRMFVFAFKVPQLPNGYAIMEGSRTIMVPYKGTLYADAQTHAVMRIQMTCTDIPSVSEYRNVGLTLEYKPTKVGGQEFLLPWRYTMDLRRMDADITIEAAYKDYRRFAADATIIFEEEPNGAP